MIKHLRDRALGARHGLRQKRRGMRITYVAAFVLLLAACGEQQTAGSTDTDIGETAIQTADSEPSVEPRIVPGPADSAEPVAKPPACVQDVPPDSICTMDINVCGNASVCGCPKRYSYDPAIGKCLLDISGHGAATPVRLDDSECAKAPASMCTRDINVCGQPSNCRCEDGFIWSAVAGKCLRDLSR